MKVMNPGNIDAQPTADADHHLWEVYVRAKLPIVHLDCDIDGGDAGVTAGGDIEVLQKSVSRTMDMRQS